MFRVIEARQYDDALPESNVQQGAYPNLSSGNTAGVPHVSKQFAKTIGRDMAVSGNSICL
jgi:hypothetical protein